MATRDDSDIPESGAVFTFGKSKFADNLPNKFWVKNDKVLQIACGDEHTALVTESGRVFMFGPNDWGQLGLGNDNKAANKPSCIKSLKHDKSRLVACGRSHTIVSTVSGHVYSFGSNSEGQLGIKDISDLTTPKRIETLPEEELKMLDAGSDSSVALTEDGRVYVWGGNEDGKLGLGKVDNAEEPVLLAMERPAVCVACGYYHTAVVTDDGKLYTMGEAEGGKLGLPEDLDSTNVPQHVSEIPDPVKWVACGSSHTVALTQSGEVYVFGDGESGQLGLGTEVLSCSKPTLLKLPFKVSNVFCGQSFTACISEKGQLYTCGDGRHGKLAHGSDVFSNQFKPFHSKRFSKFLVDRVACGGCHMIVTARPKALNGVEEDGKEEVDEMKTLISQPVESSGSPSLTRTLSARERRRDEVSRSFSSELNQTLPPLGQSRILPSLSATMPALKSSPKQVKEDKIENGFVPQLQNGKVSDVDSAHGDTEDEDHAQEKHKKDSLRPLKSPRSALTPRSSTGSLPPVKEKDKESGNEGDREDDAEDNVDGINDKKKRSKKHEEAKTEEKLIKEDTEEKDNSWNDDDDDDSDLDDKKEKPNKALKELQAALSEKDDNNKTDEGSVNSINEEEMKEETKEYVESGKETDDESRGPVPIPRKQKAEDNEDNEEEKLSEKNDSKEDSLIESDKEEEVEKSEDVVSDKEEDDKSKKDKKKKDKEDEEEDVKEEDEEEEDEKEDSKKKGKDKKKDKQDKKKEKEKDKKKKKKGKDDDEDEEEEKDEEEEEEKDKANKKSKDKKKDKKDKKKNKDKDGKGDEKDDEDEEEENDKEDKKKGKDKKDKDKKKKGKDDDSEKDENGNTEKTPPKKSRTCTIL